jgi:hypoxanthine phosphoribosyltransferase
MSVTTLGKPTVSSRQPPAPRGLVHSLDNDAFYAACAALMHQVLEVFQPDLLVGVRTGGLVVAEAMARAAPRAIPVMPLTCRRAATGMKSRIKVLPAVLASLPRPAVDGLRWLEHHLLTARRRNGTRTQQIDHAEAAAIGRHLAQPSPAHASPLQASPLRASRAQASPLHASPLHASPLHASRAQRVLVVDDAVDSGVTLATVLRLLRETSPADTELRSAVVTVTLAQPLAEPDFVLYRGVLCRFPWSFDAAS